MPRARLTSAPSRRNGCWLFCVAVEVGILVRSVHAETPGAAMTLQTPAPLPALPGETKPRPYIGSPPQPFFATPSPSIRPTPLPAPKPRPPPAPSLPGMVTPAPLPTVALTVAPTPTPTPMPKRKPAPPLPGMSAPARYVPPSMPPMAPPTLPTTRPLPPPPSPAMPGMTTPRPQTPVLVPESHAEKHHEHAHRSEEVVWSMTDPIASCKGVERQWAMCTVRSCSDCIPEDCRFGPWSDWSLVGGCTGLGVRQREISHMNNECGTPCQGPKAQTIARDTFYERECLQETQDCIWADWSEWSHCGACDACQEDRQAQSVRHRKIHQNAGGLGRPCQGDWNETRPCGFDTPVACELTDWGPWTHCSATCGGGYRAKMRRVRQEARYGGTPCTGYLRETYPCNRQACDTPRDCVLSPWSSWDGCRGEIPHQRFRERRIQQYSQDGGIACDVPLGETMGCPEVPGFGQYSPCLYSEWSPWSPCPVQCGGGQQERSRSLASDSKCNALERTPLVEVRGCGMRDCSEGGSSECHFSAWTDWDHCSEECGIGASTRERTMQGPRPKASGAHCIAALKETKQCISRPCPVVDCLWGDWDSWGACTCSCGGGLKRRNRMVKVSPRQGGLLCAPEDQSEVHPCNTQSCDHCIDAKWSNWGTWSDCTASCLPAYRWRHRGISRRQNHCGKPAVGFEEEYEMCHHLQACDQDRDCALSEWGEWGDCSDSCNGVKERRRRILNFAKGGGRQCDKRALKEVAPCLAEGQRFPPPACEEKGPKPCHVGEWDLWSRCSATCDGGQKTRVRQLLAPSSNGGKPCEAVLSQIVTCNMEHCGTRHCIDCRYTAWSEWGACSKCGGQRYRQRSIDVMPNDCGRKCYAASLRETSRCNSNCGGRASYCRWSEWAGMSDCSATCGSATMMRRRGLEVVQDKPLRGLLFVGDETTTCAGEQSEVISCDYVSCDSKCEKVDCQFSSWGPWSEPSCTQLCERRRDIVRASDCGGHVCSGIVLETKHCWRNCDSPVDCLLGQWEEWAGCDDGQRGGQKTRNRLVIQLPKNGGAQCTGHLSETHSCEGERVPVNCVLGSWMEWGECTQLCGGGTRQRSRKFDPPASDGGMPCQAHVAELVPCNEQRCHFSAPVSCVLSMWSEWTPCDSDNQEVRVRRVARQPANGGEVCQGTLHEGKPCATAVDCRVSAWTPWDECDKTCDGGQRQRQRQVEKNPRGGGKLCPSNLAETSACNRQPCVNDVNCRVSAWSSWGDCVHQDSSCGPGFQARHRQIIQKLSHCGVGCIGNLTEVRGCYGEPCDDSIDCAWGEWGQWSDCSRHCGGGQHHRERNITRWPRPGARPCEAKDKVYTAPCNMQPCPKDELCIDGEWNDWRDWEACSTTCEGGITWRTRSVRREATECGRPPVGIARDEAPCMIGVPCTQSQDCEFGQWGPWSDCSASCSGVKTRTRRIKSHGYGDGIYCEGPLKETWPCAFNADAPLLNWQSPDLSMRLDSVINNNLAGKGPGSPHSPKHMRFKGVALTDGSRTVDLMVTAGSGYAAARSSLNGLQGAFGNVNLQEDGMAGLVFELVDSDTDEAVVVNDLVLKFVDLDEGTQEDSEWAIAVKTACEEYYTGSQGTRLDVRGACGGSAPVVFRKPLLAEPQCGANHRKDLDLRHVVHSNLGGRGPDISLPRSLRYGEVCTIAGTTVDLVIEVADESTYMPSSPDANGNYGSFGIISLLPGTATSFKARFVQAGTDLEVHLAKFNLTFFDIDQPNSFITEVVTVGGYREWYYPEGISHLVRRDSDRGTSFTSSKISVPEPLDPHSMSPEQEACSVTFFFAGASQIPFTLEVQQRGSSLPKSRRQGQAFMFSGSFCEPGPHPYEEEAPKLEPLEVPEAPQPQPTPAVAVAPFAPEQAAAPALPGEVHAELARRLEPVGPSGPVSIHRRAPSSKLPWYPDQHRHRNCQAATRPVVPRQLPGMGLGSLTPQQERRAVAIRFKATSQVSVVLATKGGCGHNFLFVGKVCVSGFCDTCGFPMGCTFLDWNAWGPCSRECGGGIMNRSRDVLRVPIISRDDRSKSCDGSLSWARSCNSHSCDLDCEPRDCRWEPWGTWSACGQCGGGRTRHRRIATLPACGGRACEPASAEQVEKCPRACGKGHLAYCIWDDWEPFSVCSVSCGCGRKSRQRSLKAAYEQPEEFEMKIESYEQLQGELRDLKARRVRSAVTSFACGSLSLLALFAALRACARATPRQGVALSTDRGDEEALVSRSQVLGDFT